MSDHASTRSAEYVVPIAAPADAVWRALTDPRELERWFPLTASVTPGVGGEYVLRWGDVHSGDDWPILAWEPVRHLRIGMPKPPGAPAPPHIITDFELENQGGRTVLRVVASGFDPAARWETFFDGIRRGWRFELRSLRHYLEHHRGEARVVAWARTSFDSTNEEMWSRLFGPGGWVPDRPIDQLGEGDCYRLTAPDGTIVSGTVYIVDRPTDFTGSVDEVNGGVLRVQLEPARAGGDIGLWLGAYGVAPERMQALERGWQTALGSVAAPVAGRR
jgi:uncharacterized protein YndB with AHSA1/START domain